LRLKKISIRLTHAQFPDKYVAMLVEIYVVINEREKERTDEWIGENWTRRLVRIACGESKRKTRAEKRRGQSCAHTMERKCSHPE